MNTRNLYHREQQKKFEDIFQAPDALYRGFPFWAWNNRLEKKQLIRQIEIFKEMGLGGFHMHPRTGLKTAYLSNEFMDMVRVCVKKARKENMLAWLYDEDRWPSGAAGGLVTADKRYRNKYLVLTREPYDSSQIKTGQTDPGLPSLPMLHHNIKSEDGRLLAKYAVTLNTAGYLSEYHRLQNEKTKPGNAVILYVYLETMRPSCWFNNQTYVDTLNKQAIKKFIEVTYKRYQETVGNEFGKTVPGIFTDEPQFTHKQTLSHPADETDIVLPFTDDFSESFHKTYGYDILDYLPEILWELPDERVSVARYHYHDHITERFTCAFADQIGAWCQKNHLLLTGHLMLEDSLNSQTRAVGEAMRSYRSFQLPGIDILFDAREFNAAKQAQSVSRQYGCGGVLSELYGVTGWDYNFAGHKSQGDWQAALGITARVHHLAWLSMAGEAKRDYPASVSYQSPWYKQYPLVEDHFARVNAAMVRGRARVRVGVIHPIESYWLNFGPVSQTAMRCEEMEHSFKQLCEWLLFGLIDFDYISESLLPAQNRKRQGNRFRVGEMDYELIIVPNLQTIRSSTLEQLEAFVAAGGKLIFIGKIPPLVDALPSERALELAKKSDHIVFAKSTVLDFLEKYREIDVINAAKRSRAKSLLHQLREEGKRRYLFICNSAVPGETQDCLVRIWGEWQLSLLDTNNGKITPLEAVIKDGVTTLSYIFYPHGHLLLKLEPAKNSVGSLLKYGLLTDRQIEASTLMRLASPVPVTLAEPNVLVLDQAQWRLDRGKWRPKEEILRLDNQARHAMGIGSRSEYIPQPWSEPDNPEVLGRLELRFEIDSKIAVTSPLLAIEAPDETQIWIDGTEIEVSDVGWWVDEAIRTVPLPDLGAGKHELIIKKDYRGKTNIEWCYLLGNFGVELHGSSAVIVAMPEMFYFGNIVSQGLPFYAGNITYHSSFTTDSDRNLSIRIPHFAGAMVGIKLDGEKMPGIAYAPYETDLGVVKAGEHALDMTLYGNRFNAFGPLHNSSPKFRWWPNSWRSNGDHWTYEYAVRPQGIIRTPVIRIEEKTP